LRLFFGVPPAGKNFGHVIKKCKSDKFRSLQSLIKRETQNPSLANVELLAWLIDFTPRPLVRAQQLLGNTNEFFSTGNSVIGTKEGKPIDDSKQNNFEKEKLLSSTPNAVSIEGSLQDGGDEVSATEKKNAGNVWQKNKKAITIILIGTACVGGLYVWQQERGKQMALENVNTGCMYWSNDHYEAMPCNEEQKDRLKLPMDPEKMKNFKRILKEDTITERSIGKVYYIKIDGKIEYYTTGGNHPVYVTRPLKPLSTHMFVTYLRKQENTNKDSIPK